MSDWVTKRLGDILQLNYGKSLPVKSRIEGPYPVYGSNGAVGTHNTAIVNKPGLIVGRKGSAGRVHYSQGPFCPIDTTFYVTEDDAPNINLEFLYYLLCHLDLTRIIGDVGVPGLNREMAYMEPVEFTSALAEQKKIAHTLSTVQQAIEAQERIIQTTTELKKALMHKFFTEGLRNEPQKQTEIGPVPESWVESTLGDITTLRSGGTPSRKNKNFWVGGSIPWVKTGEINYREITVTEEMITEEGLRGSNAKLLPKGTLLVAMYGQGITRGRVGILGIDATTNQACAAVTPRDEMIITTDYLYFYLEYFYEELRSRGHGANQKNLSMTLLKIFPVAFPAKCDQEAITRALKSADKKIALATTKRTALQGLSRTLLHELMTAKTRVHELELSG